MSDFRIYSPLSFFEKSGVPEAQKRRIAGVVSTEIDDKQEEKVLQRGLDFSPFMKEGWFNDNHSKNTGSEGVVGYPDGPVKVFAAGDILPDGEVAKANCTWAEGYLLDTPKAHGIWELGQALAKSGSKRRLGFSIEGKVLQRTGPGNKIVAKAVVRNIAITNCPVGQETRMEVLAKSLDAVEKGLTVGTPTPGVAPTGPMTGAAGHLLSPESLEGRKLIDLASGKKSVNPDDDDDGYDSDDVAKAINLIQNELGVSTARAIDVFETLLDARLI